MDVVLFAAGMGLFLLVLVLLGVIADGAERREARKRNRARPWR